MSSLTFPPVSMPEVWGRERTAVAERCRRVFVCKSGIRSKKKMMARTWRETTTRLDTVMVVVAVSAVRRCRHGHGPMEYGMVHCPLSTVHCPLSYHYPRRHVVFSSACACIQDLAIIFTVVQYKLSIANYSTSYLRRNRRKWFISLPPKIITLKKNSAEMADRRLEKSIQICPPQASYQGHNLKCYGTTG